MDLSEKKPFITEGHTKARRFFRIVGPLVVLIGILFMGIGLFDFFQAFNSFSMGPTKFHYMFIGMPLLFIGIVLCNLGYGSVAARYVAREMAPVTSDTFNYVGHEIQDGVKEISRAVTEGRIEAIQEVKIHCKNCSAENDHNANFCSICGQTLKNTCNDCFEENPADANFCNKCGNELV